MEYYANNMWVVENCESDRFHRAAARLPELADKGAESHVAEKASVRNCWLAGGVEVEGTVEDSIIFPNVHIRRGCHVSRSVVLNGNRIGAGTEIHNTLVLPITGDMPRSSLTIGENCSIGARNSTMRNGDFPTQIRDGITVIGANADIPNGFQAEAACYVAPGVAASALRRIKVVRKGSSILNGHPRAAPGEKK
jgi:ADP-glucose pyrophosphorylase